MASNLKKTDQHMFSIQLKSKDNLKTVALPGDEEGHILIEGFLGKLENVSLIEGIMLQVNGVNGNLRMDLSKEELTVLLPKGTPIHKKSSKETKNLKDTKAQLKKLQIAAPELPMKEYEGDLR